MRTKIATTLLLVSVLVMPSVSAISIVNNNNSSSSISGNSNSNIIDRSKLFTISLPFIENVGQYPDEVKYYADTFIGRVVVYNDRIQYLLDK